MKSDTSKIFGLTIKHYRTNLKVSQEELAEKCGFHRTYVGQIERGERNPSLKSIAVLSDRNDISESEKVKIPSPSVIYTAS